MENSAQARNLKIVSQVGQYIYDHSDQAISLEKLACYTGFSKYHFNRIFFAATGYPLGEFIQRHKLEKAIHLIRQGNHNIIDVALSVGYDSPSSFSRAFKKNFSITPTDVIEGASPTNDRAGSLPPKKLLGDQKLEPIWKVLPEITVYGLYGRGFTHQSFSTVAEQLYNNLADIAAPLSFSAVKPIGVSVDNPWVGEQTQSLFFAGFIEGLTAQHNRLDSFIWQGGQWACFTHHGPHNTMWQTISQIYAQWVLPNNIKLKDQQIVQRYLNNPKTTAAKDLETQLYFAVEDNK